ncbi:MAG: DUF177 domain-containing protein [Nitrospirota bacterium]
MWIRLSEIPPQGVVVSSPTPAAQLGLGREEWWTDEPVRVQLVVTRDGDDILIDGEVAATLRFRCSRCLEECTYPVRTALHVTLAPAGPDAPEGHYQLNAADLEQAYYREGGVETNEVVREQLLLAIPMQVVCRPGCRGLCASCGRNLNEGPCECPGPPDSPWVEQLKRLATMTKEKKGRTDQHGKSKA